MIQLTSVTKMFKRGSESILALDNVSIAIAPGEFLAITGSSGSGKSTLLHIIGLLDSVSQGSYLLQNTEVSALNEDEAAHLRNSLFGFIFQSFHLMPKLTAAENVAMPLYYADPTVNASESARRAQEVLRLVHLEDRMHHLPSELSGGQRQRVAIARALIGNPKVILADEPTGNLDSKNAREVIDMLELLHKRGVTVILVTHDNEIASRIPRRVILKDGKIESDALRRG